MTDRLTNRLLFSPHADDVVLSCFGALTPGATVVTVLAGVPEDPDVVTDWDRRLGARSSRLLALQRLDEDAAAFAGTGVRLVAWPYLDGQYRTGPPDRAALLTDVRAQVAGADEVWLPAGIYAHPDHVLVRDAGLAACTEARREGLDVDVRLYAEYPYQLYQMDDFHKAREDRGPYDWTNRGPRALAEWFRAEFPTAREGGEEPAEVLLTREGAEAKDAAVRSHASQLGLLDEMVHGVLMEPENIGREYWWSATELTRSGGHR
ncbi:PIG-L family deacetylase [Streptomyces sp. NPDC088341]|uniref:PIG-L deacetylase family protein n=1 Tax=Streptomyces sp. NPDC088341 TaxID=3154870 RepID=UPI0034199628